MIYLLLFTCGAFAWFFSTVVAGGAATLLIPVVYMLPGSILGAIIGAWSLTQFDSTWIQVFLGLFLVTYVLQERFSKTVLTFGMPLRGFFPLGFGVACLSGLIGATGPLHNPFLMRYGLVKESLVGTKSVNSLVMQLTKLLSYGGLGLLTLEVGIYGLALGLGATLGVYLARHQLRKLEVEQFRQYVLAFMFVSGITLLIKALS